MDECSDKQLWLLRGTISTFNRPHKTCNSETVAGTIWAARGKGGWFHALVRWFPICL